MGTLQKRFGPTVELARSSKATQSKEATRASQSSSQSLGWGLQGRMGSDSRASLSNPTQEKDLLMACSWKPGRGASRYSLVSPIIPLNHTSKSQLLPGPSLCQPPRSLESSEPIPKQLKECHD